MKNFIVSVIASIVAGLLLPLMQSVITVGASEYEYSFDEGIMVFIAFLGGFWLFYFIRQYERRQFNKLSNYSIPSSDSKRYSVLIVDDLFGIKKLNAVSQFQSKFNEYDMCFLAEISDTRLLHEYDILIIDILNASMLHQTTATMFDSIRDCYPEKYVVAMSVNAGELISLTQRHNVNSTITKPQLETSEDIPQLIKLISDELKSAFNMLDNPISYWENNRHVKNIDSKHEGIAHMNYLEKLNRNSYVEFRSPLGFKKNKLI